MKTQRALGQVIALALLAVLSGAVCAATHFSANVQGDATDKAGNTNYIDVVIIHDKSGSMEYETVCYGCWEPSDEQYPSGNIYPLPWSSSTIESADHCANEDPYHVSGDEYYIVIEAEEYSRLNVGGADYTRAITTPYHTYWAVQRNHYNAWAGEPVGAMGRDTRGAYMAHHPFPNYSDTTGLGVSCTWDDLVDGEEYCRRDLPEGAGGPFPAPRADYGFYAPRAGNYYFHIRGQGGGREGDGYIHWGVDGGKGRKGGFPLGPRYDGAVESAWKWSRLGDAVWLSEGRHTLHLWAGGAGFDVDRIIITTDSRSSLPSSIRALPANDGRTDWACDPCDPRFAGRPGGHEWTAEEPYYRPHCDQDQRYHPIYDDEQPIRAALEAAKYFVSRLNPCFDQMGYVPYSGNAEIASELECLRRRGVPNLGAPECDPDQCAPGEEPPCDPDCGCFAGVITNTVLYQLDRTRAGGTTNIAHGIQLGIDVLSTAAPHYGHPGAAKVMVLLTDGEANETPPGDDDCGSPKGCVLYYARQARDENIKIFTFTLGQSADQELMAEVAALTGGWHRHASTTDDLADIVDELYGRVFVRLISQKSASPEKSAHGQTLTYTVVVQGLTAPLTATIHLTDNVPEGLSYLPGTLAATAGVFTDTAAPTLRWSGVLTPTMAATVTYAATVSATTPQVITNGAVIAAPGYQTITRTATAWVNWRHVYLPLFLR